MQKFFLQTTLLFISFFGANAVYAQCYSGGPSYCTNITTQNPGCCSMGIQEVKMDTLLSYAQINNATGVGNGSPIYIDYTNQVMVARSGATVYYSVKSGPSNQSKINIFIDYNNDGTFGTSAPEMVANVPNMNANITTAGSFVLPVLAPGVYRIRVASDGQNITPTPCGPLFYAAEIEDYTLFIASPTMDVISTSFTSPTSFIAGNNTVGMRFFNPSNANITTIDIGYQLDNNTPVTQSLTGLNIGPGASFTQNFATLLNIPATGNYSLKAWATNPNGTGSTTPANDTICRTVSVYCSGPMSGNYTINPSGGPFPNFTSIYAADSALMSCGVSGPVVFTITAPGTYTATGILNIPAITGASAVNTITFDGVNSATSILTAATTSGLPSVLRLNACSFVTFKNFTIRTTGATDGWAVHFLNGTNNKVSKCLIDIGGSGATSGNSNLSGVVINGNLTSISTSSSGNTHTVDSSTFNAGYYNIYVSSGSNGTFNFLNNTLNNAYQYGGYFNSNHIVKFKNNIVNLRTTISSNTCLYFINCNASGLNFHEISNNRFNNVGQYAIQLLSASGSGSSYGQLYNNFMGGFRLLSGNIAGISNAGSSRWQVWHNNININLNCTAGINACINLSSGSLFDIRNNYLSITANNCFGAVPLFLSTSSIASVVDYNNYFNKSNSLFSSGAITHTILNYKAAYPAGLGLNSINMDPAYINNNSDLHISKPCLDGANLSVALDIDGQTRAGVPDIGADELVTLPNNDLGVLKINSPSFPLASGSQSINVTIRNYGSNTVTSGFINYQVNGGSVVSQAWSGSLAPCDTANITFTVPYNFSGSSNLKVFTTNPNALTDANFLNDTAQWTMCLAMSGTYTIGGGGNYATFNAAINDMYCAGINGPVTFNVANGIYNEQVNINYVLGSSPSNRIRFTSASGNPALTTLTFNPPSSGSFVLQFNGADFITFDRMTISSSYATTIYMAYLNNGSDFDSISNCIINNPNTNASGVYQNGTTDKNFTLFNTTINNGNVGLNMNSNSSIFSTNHAYVNNSLLNQTAAGIVSNYQDSILISGNTITTNAAASTYNGINTQSNSKFPRIVKNRITGIVGGSSACYGIQLNSFASNGASFGRGLIANNFIQLGGNATTTNGVRFNSGSNNIDFMHNTINMTSTTLSANIVCLHYATSLSNNIVQNNIFHVTGTPSAACAVANIGTSGTSGCVFNNNDWYTPNSTTFGYSNTSLGTARATYALFKTGAAGITNFETVGVSKEVSFVSNTDLHTTAPCVADLGANVLAKVADDIDNQARSTTPDLGADEYSVASLDAMVTAVRSPTGYVVLGSPTTYSVKITIKNNGTTTLTSVDGNYSVNGAVTTQSFTGLNIAPCDTLQLTFTVNASFASGGNNVFRAFTSNPNGSTDLYQANDTLTTNYCTPFTGTVRINKNNPVSQNNFQSVQSAVNALYSCGIAGPVTLRIDAGSGPYNEQVLFNGLIPGSSATNTVRLSGNTTREAITFNPTTNTLQHTVRLQGAKFIILDSLTINNTGTSFGIGVHLTSTSDNNVIKNSIVNISLVNTGLSNSAGIAISSLTSSATGTGNNGNFNLIDNNTINGGHFGIAVSGTSTSVFCVSDTISNNRLNGQATYGIYASFMNNQPINGNSIDNMLATNLNSFGAYFNSVDKFEFKRNSINRVGQYGLFMQNVGAAVDRSEVSNNMIGGIFYTSTPYAISLNNIVRNVDFYHNSISVTNCGSGYALYYQTFSGFSNLNFRNNSFAVYGASSGNNAMYMYASYNVFQSNTSFNYNNIYSDIANSYLQVGYNSYLISPSSGWITASFNTTHLTMNTSNSKSVDPSYLSRFTNLHTISSGLSNCGLNGLSTIDLDGQTRPLSPDVVVDMGADEFNIPGDNCGAFAVINPNAPLSPGLQNVVVQIKNYGANTLTSANVSYKVGILGSIKTIAWTGSVATNGVSNATFTGANQYNFTGSFDTIYTWTDGPNGQPDGFLLNDTIYSIVCNPLAGNYTIDTTLPTSGSNFGSWSAAINSLTNCGITGPVTINVVQPGTYVGAIDLLPILGTSATNTVTFNGINSANRVLVASTSAIAPAVVRFNNCNYVTFRNFTIRTLDANNGWCAHFFNGLNNRISNCILDIGGAGTASGSGNLLPAVINGSYTSINTATTTGNNHRIDSSTLNAGYYGIYINASNGALTYYVLNNNLNSQYQYAGYFNNSHVVKFNNNNINMRIVGSNSYGVYFVNNNPTGANFHEVNGNKFINIGQYGIYMTSTQGSSSGIGQMYNNMISGFRYTSGNVGVYMNSASRWNVWHNSINLDFASVAGQNNCLYVQNGNTIDVRNNILSITSPSIVSAVPLYVSPSSAINNLNSNDYYNISSANLITGGINSNVTNYKLAFPSGGGLASINADPRYINNSTDLHTLNGCNGGLNLGLTLDIDNQSRGSSPDMGADETGPILNNDVGVLKLNTPSWPLLAGSTNINVTLKNYGANTLNTVDVSYMVNGGSLTTQSLTGLSLAPCDTMNFTFTTPYNVVGSSSFVVFTSNPNGSTDTYFPNDTVTSSLCLAMSGVYTIGVPPYSTFTQAVAALNCAGVSGPVTFNVNSGSYNEQFTLGAIQGASAVNTITFDGGAGNAASRVITFAGNASNPHTFRMSGSQFIRVRNLTIRSTDGTNAWPLNLIDCQNVIVSNCNIEVAGAGATSTTSNLGAVVINGSTTNITASTSLTHNVFVDSNNIKGGYYGIYVNGNNVNTNYLYTRYNNVDSSYLYGIYNNVMTHRCNYNRIYMRFNGHANSSGLYVPSNYMNTPDFSTFNYNQIYNCRQYGIYLSNFYSNYGINQQVNNNVVGKFVGTGVVNGIRCDFSTTSEFYHNTVDINVATSGAHRAFNIAAYGSVLVRNNLFSISNAAATNSIPVQFTSASATCSNNDYYNAASTNLIQTTSGTFTSANGTFPTAGGGTGSINVNPQFPSFDNLRPGAGVGANDLNSAVSFATLPYDMDNNPRVPPLGTATPDMGAYEKTVTNIGVSAITAPISVTAGNVYSISVRIRNYGTNSVSGFPVKYNLNGGATVTETYAPTLNPNDSVVFTFATTATFSGCNSLKTWTELSGDTYGANDSTNMNIGGSLIGTYTIKVTGGNFTSFADAVAFLQCGVVTGPITILADPKVYTEQITIPNNILGVSATNTITFDGGNASSVILTFPTGSSASGLSHVLRFNNCNYVTFRNMTIRSSGASEAWTVHFMNGTNNRLNNCIVDMTGSGVVSTNTTYSAVVINGSTTNINTNSTIANNHRIDSSVINYGYYGLFCNVNNGNNTNYFLNNTWNNGYQYGVYFQNGQTIKFNNNIVNTRSSMTSSYAIYATSINPAGANFNEFRNNAILRTGQYGFYIQSSQGGTSNLGQIYNNTLNGMTYNFNTSGIYLSSASNWNIYHNTVNHDILSAGGPNYGIQIQNGSNNNVLNNMISTTIPTTSSWTPIYITPSSAVASLNANNYWNPSSANLVNIAGVNYTAANFKANYPLGGGVNSLNNNPSYVSASNLHVTNPCNNGLNLGIATDIDGHPRGSTPDMGSDEMNTVPNNDLGVSVINSPGFPLVPGSQSINVTLKNFGGNTITSADINYRVNGGAITTQSWIGVLAPCDTISLTLTTPYTFTSGSSNLKVYTTSPNGLVDATPSNDTAQWTLCPALAGIYTIGVGKNYLNFNAAINDLNCGGVSGPVTFIVDDGVFNEQVNILPINGASSSKRIRFTSASGNRNLTTLTFTPSSPNSFTLQFNGADYVTFDRMTIANGYTASTVYTVWLNNGADFDSISNCNIINPINNSAFAIYQNNTIDKSFTLFNDSISNGAYGIYMQGNTSNPSTNHAYVNNTILNQTIYGVYSYYHDSVLISGNTITTNNSSGSYYGIYSYFNTKFTRIVKNKIVGINYSSGNTYGIQAIWLGNNGFSFGRCLIANNFIQMGGSAPTNYGIQLSSVCNYTDVMHNTVNMTSTVVSPNVACFYYQTGLNSNNVQNNIFQASGNGVTSCAVANIGTSGTSSCVFNNNNWFTRNPTTFGYCGSSNGTAVANFAAFKAGGAAILNFENASLDKEVNFVSTTDLHTTTPCIANAGANTLAIVPDDIDNTSRTNPPDIGADEFTTNTRDASVLYVRSPATSVVTTGLPYTVIVTVKNNGSSNITALDANYSVNGAVTSQSFTGLNIAACDTAQLTFTVPYTFGSGGNNVFKAFTGNVNTLADQNNANDTFVTNFCTAFSGVFTINKNLPQSQTNFTSVQSAVNAVYSCGVNGPVTLRIDAGSGPYNEQVLFSGIVPGSSATNTVRLTGNTTKETITWLPITSNQQHTIRLQSAKHIILDSLTINNTGTSYGIGVHITATSDSNYVQNSNVNISLASTSFSNSAGIAISSNAASATGSGNNGNKNTINNNTITGGYHGITSFGTNTTTFCLNNQFTNNTLTGQAYYGMYLAYQSLTSINGNNIDNILSTNVSSMGMRFEYVERFEIKKNKINRVGNYGMYFNFANYQLGSGIDQSEISNNMIGGIFYSTSPYGMNFTSGGCRNINFYHNSISIMNAGSGYAFQMQYSNSGFYGGLVFKNNSFVVYNGSQYAAYFYWQTSGMLPAQPIDSFKNNNVWNSNTGSTTVVFGQSGYSTNGWISPSASGLNTSTCLWVDPQYINPSTNLHTVSGALSNNGTNIASVTTDIDGDTRPLSPSSTVDIGADEFNVPAENIGAFAIISPTLPLITGLQDVVVQIKNFGVATITSANVNYKVGLNGSTKTVAWTGSIATNATTNVTFTGANQFNFTGSFDTIIAWTDAPNGLPDGFVANDTTSSLVCQPLTGVYTMDTTLPASATNFVNFNSIATKLNNCGVSGPVTINIANGTYSEQFTLNQIYGTSTTNTVTFQSASGNAANVVIQFNGGSSAANNYVVKMNGADNTIWRNLTLQSTNVSYSTLVLQLNNTRFNTYRKVVFNGPTVFTTSSNNALVYANNTALVNAGQGDDNNTFDSCAFNNGSYGISSNAQYSSAYTYNCAFTNNTFTNQYYMGMNLAYHLSMNIYNNFITTNSSFNNYYGINYASNTGIVHTGKISRNRISAPNANGYGIYAYYMNGPNAEIINNMINIGSGAGSQSTGISISYSNCKVQHNTVNVTSGNTSSIAMRIENYCCYTNPPANIRYNIFANSGNGSSSGFCIYSVNNNTTLTLIDSNVYYQGPGASSFGSILGTLYANLTAWQSAMGAPYDVNSIVANPNFFSPSNPRINSVANIRSVPRQTYMTEDIDGARCGVITETGADDHPATNDIGVSSISNPLNGVASPGLTTISVYLRNYGSNSVTSANVTYDISGTVVTQAWTGSLNPCDSVLFSFSTQYNFSGGFTMKAFTTSPNGASDAVPANDTVIVGGCLGMAGLYTIDTAGSGPTNFLSFNAALTAMASCGISGPVVFDVKAATYNEQVLIPFINGTSATSTVTFNGGNGNAASRVLTFTTTTGASPYVLRFNGAQHVYFRNITINSTNVNDAWNVNFINSKRCGISNCIVSNLNYSPNNTSFNVHGVLLNGSTTNYSTSSNTNDSIYIDSNAISTGYFNLSSWHTDGSKTIFIRGNNLTQAPYSAVYIQGNQTAKIIGNTMTIRIGGSAYVDFTMRLVSSNPTGTNFHEISNNIFRESYNGAMLISSSSGNASASGLISNNMISNFYYNSSQNYGIYTTSANYWKIYHNSINYALGTNGNSSYCYYNANGSNIDLRNNIFAVTNSSAANCIPFYTNNNNAFISNNIDYNNYFNAAGTTLVNLAGTLYTASNYKATFTNPTGGGAGANSFNFNPQFVSATDLHRSTICYNGANVGITTDIDNQVRTSTPDIGADEVAGSPDDISIESILSPTSTSVSAGPINITVLLRNVGTSAVTSGNLTYILNGGTPVVVAIPSTINSCDTLSVILTGLTMVSGTNTFVAFTSQPNGNTDANFSNDTIRSNYCTPLSGTFTVGGASPDYANFTAAVAALNCGGINGPVVFNVRGGTYNEFIQINSIPGSSPTNTVVFQSDNGVASSVTLQNNIGGSYVIKLVGTDNISFRNMTINTNLSSNNPVQIVGTADSCVNVTLYGNTIGAQWGAFTTANAALIATGKNPNLTVRKNTIYRASFGIYVLGNSTLSQYNQNLVIDSNFITASGNDVFQGIFVQYSSAPKIKYNSIQKFGCCADRGIEINNTINGGECSYNKLITTGGFAYGLLMQNINNIGETTPFFVFNNFISANSGGFATYIASSNYVNYFNNSTYLGSGSYTMYVNSNGTNNNINIINNSFKSASGLTSLFVGGTNITTARAMIGECNYNNYYQGSGSAGENLLNLQGTNYTISTIKGAIKPSSPMSDSNSNASNPQYKSNTDLRILPSSGLDGRGKLLSAFFTDDIDGVKRLTNSFDIGADDTAVIRTTSGDYVASSSCINISGTSWIDVTDTFGKLVFSINPEGNNLGPTCWGLRLNTAGLRKDSILNSADGFKYLSYFLDRNLYINPTTQPASGTQVSLRFYCKQSEWQLLADTALTFGVTLNQYYMKMHRFHEPAATSSLVPLTTPTVNDSSHFLYVMNVNNYGVDKYLQYRTNHFSQFNPVFIPNVTPMFLPVTWLSFEAKANGSDAVLDWATASERNSKDFDIERSVDGKEFTSVGKVKAAGNSSMIQTYSFIDKDAASLNTDKVYYRLKQNDLDGQFEYSKIRVVQFKGKDGIIVHSVSPNPFNTNVSADFTLLAEDQVSLILTNISGQVVKIEQMQGQKGDNNYSMNTEEFAAGVYFLKIQTKDNQFIYKLIKN